MFSKRFKVPWGLGLSICVLLLTAARCRVDEPIKAHIFPREQTVSLGTTVELSGNLAYWDGKPISQPEDAWSWTLDARPAGSSAVIQVNARGNRAQFVPDVAGVFVVSLNVTFSDRVYVASATITVVVEEAKFGLFHL